MAVQGCNKRDNGWGGCVGGESEAGILEWCGRFCAFFGLGFALLAIASVTALPVRIHPTFCYQVNPVPRRHFRWKPATRCSLYPTHSPSHIQTSPQ